MCNLLLQDCPNEIKKVTHELKLLLEPHLGVYQKFIKQIYCYKSHWLRVQTFTGGLHSYNRTATI
jgi:hypothetical protein